MRLVQNLKSSRWLKKMAIPTWLSPAFGSSSSEPRRASQPNVVTTAVSKSPRAVHARCVRSSVALISNFRIANRSIPRRWCPVRPGIIRRLPFVKTSCRYNLFSFIFYFTAAINSYLKASMCLQNARLMALLLSTEIRWYNILPMCPTTINDKALRKIWAGTGTWATAAWMMAAQRLNEMHDIIFCSTRRHRRTGFKW